MCSLITRRERGRRSKTKRTLARRKERRKGKEEDKKKRKEEATLGKRCREAPLLCRASLMPSRGTLTLTLTPRHPTLTLEKEEEEFSNKQ